MSRSCTARRCPPVTGIRRCHCPRCHRGFTGITAFDKHQVIQDDGVSCRDPAACGLVPYDHRGTREWGWPPTGRPWVTARSAAR